VFTQPRYQGSVFLTTKITILSRYKFANVFENSNSKDYVTEKLFGAFVSGSIPIHMGDSNVQKFGPSPKSIISVHDFQNAEELAKYLKYLSSNETAYNEYLSWKTEGVSKRWRAMVDMSRVHSWCRLCIRVGDLNRWKNDWDEVFSVNNPYYEENVLSKSKSTTGGILVKARERGKYWFKAIYLYSRTYVALYDQIVNQFPGDNELWDIYRLKKTMWDAEQHYRNDEELQKLEEGEEIEIIFLDILEGSPATKWDAIRSYYINKKINNINKSINEIEHNIDYIQCYL